MDQHEAHSVLEAHTTLCAESTERAGQPKLKARETSLWFSAWKGWGTTGAGFYCSLPRTRLGMSEERTAELTCICISSKPCKTNKNPNNPHRYTYNLHFCLFFFFPLFLYPLVNYSFNFPSQACRDSQEGQIGDNITTSSSLPRLQIKGVPLPSPPLDQPRDRPGNRT